MEKHISILGALWVAVGVLLVIVAAAMVVIFGIAGVASGDETATAIVGAVGIFVTLLLMAFSLPAFFAGFGLLGHKSWSKLLVIVLAILNVLSFPFGTALAIYSFWVVSKAEGTALLSA